MFGNYLFCNILVELFGYVMLKFFGWKIEGQLFVFDKFVVIGVYYILNWDFVVFFVVKFVLCLNVCWFGKYILFNGLLGGLMWCWGGILIQCYLKLNIVDQVIQVFCEYCEFMLIIVLEGMCKKVDCWCMGFYYIVCGVGVLVVLVVLDYENWWIVIGEFFWLIGNEDVDLCSLIGFYWLFILKKLYYVFFGD